MNHGFSEAHLRGRSRTSRGRDAVVHPPWRARHGLQRFAESAYVSGSSAVKPLVAAIGAAAFDGKGT
jgi:hypothetical protein